MGEIISSCGNTYANIFTGECEGSIQFKQVWKDLFNSSLKQKASFANNGRYALTKRVRGDVGKSRKIQMFTSVNIYSTFLQWNLCNCNLRGSQLS